jgi:DNA polymerase III epsilon subunit-like protein
LIVLDVEATGLDHEYCSLLSIGAVDFDNPDNTFYGECRADENAVINEKSLKYCGFTIEQMKDPSKQTSAELVNSYHKWTESITDRTLAGQNVHFDYYWLNKAYITNQTDYYPMTRLFELHTLAYLKYMQSGFEIPLKGGGSDLGLPQILEFVGLEDFRTQGHNALEDAKIETECLYRLIFGQGVYTEFTENEIPDYLVALAIK